MENMDKGLTVSKWMLINWPKITKCPKIYLPKLSAQARKFGISMKKELHWASVVCESGQKMHLHLLPDLAYYVFFNISRIV